MKEYLVCEVANLKDVSIQHARRFNEEEKKEYADWYKEKGFVGISESIKLHEIKLEDVKNILNNRQEDGSFDGCNNSAYIITSEEWDKLIELNNQRLKDKEQKVIMNEIEKCNSIIEACEKQNKLYTKEEADKKRIEYNNLYNEGGEGFITHYYTIDEYEFAKAKLEKLKK